MSNAHNTDPCFICPKCGMTSYHPRDIEYGYCAKCCDWTGDYLSDPRGKVTP